MSWSFDSIIKGVLFPDDPKRTLDIMDQPDMFVQRYGVHHMEMQHATNGKHIVQANKRILDEECLM